VKARAMDATDFIALMRASAWTGLVISLPVLGVALVVGLGIGLLQALTSIQELTLTFVPKLVAIVIVFWASLGFMTSGLVGFFQRTVIPLAGGG
jgi:flagellar biosynthetic protein FliQ